MKKRRIAAAAIGLGLFQTIGTIGALPAQAAAPVVAADACTVTAGTLFATGDAGVGSGTVELSYSDGIVSCNVDAVSKTFDLSVTAETFTDVVVTAEGDFALYLNDGSNAAAWPAFDSFRVAAHRVTLDAWSVHDSRDDISAVLADDAFEVGDISAEITYATAFTFIGGAGDDTLDASDVTLRVIAEGWDGADTLEGGAGNDSFLGAAGADKLYGGDGNDALDCSDAEAAGISDQCWGGDGDDDISADAKAGGNAGDIVAPGDGQDTIDNALILSYADSSDSIEVDLSTSKDVSSASGDDDVTGTIGTYVGSGDADSLTGNGSANSFNGGGGDDTITGYDGADTLVGGGGDDAIFGGGGSDTIAGNGGSDTIYGGADADVVRGGGGDDVMYGLSGADDLRGGTGSDQAWGGRGADTCLAEVKDHCELAKIN